MRRYYNNIQSLDFLKEYLVKSKFNYKYYMINMIGILISVTNILCPKHHTE